MAWTNDDLQKVDAAIASGEMRIRFADREVEYRSIKDLLLARDAISQSIANSTGTVIKRHTRIYSSNGW